MVNIEGAKRQCRIKITNKNCRFTVFFLFGQLILPGQNETGINYLKPYRQIDRLKFEQYKYKHTNTYTRAYTLGVTWMKNGF